MPLKLIEPRPGKSKNYSIRGTYLKQYVDRSAGTPVKATAQRALLKIKGEIERGEFSNAASGPTFLNAALAYIKAGGDPRFIGDYDEPTRSWSGLIGYFGVDRLLSEIDQDLIDAAATKLYPTRTPATRNRQVYAVVSVILKRAGVDMKIRRPKGAEGNSRTTWLAPRQAFALFNAADEQDAEFGAFIRTITYTGMRLGEALGAEIDFLDLSQAFLYVPTTKNGNPRGVHLPPVVVSALASHPRGLDRKGERIFRFSKCGRLYTWLEDALVTAGIPTPPRTGFHVLRHTWGTWMRQYGGLDTHGLVGTGTWSDAKSAARYSHVVATDEAKRADLLPVENGQFRGKSVDKKEVL